jgi:hypothetical protein
MIFTAESARCGENQVGAVDEPTRWSAASLHLHEGGRNRVDDVRNLI